MTLANSPIYVPTPIAVPMQSSDGQYLQKYLQQQLQNISVVLQKTTAQVYVPLSAAPLRPTNGMVVYADGTNWNPGQGVGLYVYLQGFWIPAFGNGRIPLVAATTFYVATTGSDTNNTGLTPGSPWATLAHSYMVLTSFYDFGGQNVTIQMADGTYSLAVTALLLSNPWTGGGTLTIQGNVGTPSNVVIAVSGTNNCGFRNTCTLPGVLNLQGMKITTASGQRSDCIRNETNGLINFQSIDFGACAGHHVTANGTGCCVQSLGNYSISGGASVHLFANAGGLTLARAITVTLSGTPNFSLAYADAILGGNVQGNGATFSGSATGLRFNASGNGVIFTNSGGLNFFPGNAAGTQSSGGQYL